MKVIEAAAVRPSDLDRLDEAISRLEDGSLVAALAALSTDVRGGADVVLARTSETVTPAQAAKVLGMSRTHLYRLMDEGALPHIRVGRDRRIDVGEMSRLKVRLERDSRELAERFARPGQSRDDAAAAVRDLLDKDPS